jgi:hypothetical protein
VIDLQVAPYVVALDRIVEPVEQRVGEKRRAEMAILVLDAQRFVEAPAEVAQSDTGGADFKNEGPDVATRSVQSERIRVVIRALP